MGRLYLTERGRTTLQIKMKGFLVVLTACLLFTQCFCMRVPSYSQRKSAVITRVSQQVGKLDTCKDCVEFAEQALNALLNIILQGGVVGTCSALCGNIPNQALATVCDLLCDVVGVEEFIKIIQKADLDPIYYCELLKTCAINDNGDAMFDSFTVTPSSGPQGSFSLAFQYTSVNGTGTGQLLLEVDTVDGLPLGQAFLNEVQPAGTYNGQFQLKAEPDPDCDPSQGPCEQWLPGNYTVKMAICNGECGSKHPNSEIYDETSTVFTITEGNES